MRQMKQQWWALRSACYQRYGRFIEALYARLPMPEQRRPTFILGCGRSGKSTLVALLSQHPDVTFLDEPRPFWLSAFPQSDIWTSRAAVRNGRLVLDASDFDPARARRLRRLFRARAIRNGRLNVVEELAVNSFRLALIHRIFPEARFVHVYRNGLEVAELIAQAAEQRGGWFGHNGYKWNQLAAYARRRRDTALLPGLCDNFRDKGLLEWRLSTEAVISFLSTLPRESYLEVNSNALLENPVDVSRRVFSLMGLVEHWDTVTADSRAARSKPRRIAIGSLKPSARARRIGGDLLDRSLQSTNGLVEP